MTRNVGAMVVLFLALSGNLLAWSCQMVLDAKPASKNPATYGATVTNTSGSALSGCFRQYVFASVLPSGGGGTECTVEDCDDIICYSSSAMTLTAGGPGSSYHGTINCNVTSYKCLRYVAVFDSCQDVVYCGDEYSCYYWA